MEIRCFYQGLVALTSLNLFWISPHLCSVVDFELVLETGIYTEQEKACRDLGYDGLAILPTPEAFNYAFHLTKPYRNVIGDSFYLGIQINNETGDKTWRDGTLLSPDTPQQTHDKGPEYLYGRMSVYGKIAFGPNTWRCYAICGYNASNTKAAHGSVAFNQGVKDVSSTLTEVMTSSFRECALMCALNNLCRAASFDLDSMTCRIIGTESSNSITLEHSSSINTFIRVSFERRK